MTGSMYRQFQTDEAVEKQGIVHDFGDFRVTIARAGGANEKYNRVLEQRAKPHLRAIRAKQMDPKKADDLLRQAYAEAVIVNWEVVVERDESSLPTKWQQGIEGPNGDILPFNKANVIQALAALPVLFRDIQEQANNDSLYLVHLREEAEGN